MLFILALTAVAVQSQSFQGKAYYESKTNIELNLDGREISEERKKMIMENMKKALEKTYILTFNQSESVYKEEERLQQPGGSRGFGGFMAMSGFSSGGYYKNIKQDAYYDEREMFGKKFLVKDSLSKLNWKLENETKKIGNYTCFKATAVKPVNQMDFRSMRRRGNNKDKKKDEAVKDTTKTNSIFEGVETPKEIVVTAWYTPEIPVSQGPGEYWGLPGLILEVSADRTAILCSKIVMNPKEKETIKAPSKGKEVTQKEYNEIVKKKMEEMREMYGRGNRRNGIRIRG